MPRPKPRAKVSRPGLRASPRKRNPDISDDIKKEDMNNDEMDEETGKGSGDTSQSDTNDPIDSKGEDDESTGQRKRGRKRKSEIPLDEKYVPAQDPTQRGIMAQGGSLRRRDTLKSSWRYSPPPVSTRRSKVDDNIRTAKMDNRKKPAILRSPATTLPNKNQKSDANDDKKMIVNMPDGFPIKVEPPKKKIAITNTPKVATSMAKPKTVVDTPVVKASDKDSSETITIEDVTTENAVSTVDEAIEKKDTTHDETEQPQTARGARVAARRKSTEPVVVNAAVSPTATTTALVTEKSKSPVRVTLTTASSAEKTAAVVVTRSSSTMHPIGMSKTQTITISTNTPPTTVTTTKNQVSNTLATSVTTSPSTTTTTATAATGTIKVPTILKPTINTPATNVSNVSKGPSIKKPVSLSKYLDTLPEIEDCIHNDGVQDAHMEKLPDKILLVHSELPLPLAISVDKEEENYLFRQIISPVNATRFVCLLCKGIDVNFGTKEEKDILLHYQSLHELDVDIGHAKFSEDIVFICLPKMILNQFNNSSSLSLNSPCQYCDTRLSDIGEMKEHYSQKHNKEVIMMEQEEIMQMHHFFYCSKCKEQSSDFDTHHKHMKNKHSLKTYRCKSCVLVTKDENRLRTHFKAKHMLHSSGQNYQCYYCHGLLIGVERLQKHIQQSHMVQTGPADYSCVACRQSCGKGKELLTHAQNCAVAGLKPEKSDLRFVPNLDCSSLSEEECLCYFCNARLESQEAYDLHLHHEHKQWVPIETATELNKNNFGDTSSNGLLTINDVINDDDLKRAQIKTYVGHWCRICDQMVKVYQLYYLHMVNHHKMEKMYQCVITSCKMNFKDFEDFMQHINETGHSQKTIISHPDEVFVCAYCDIYFASDEELTSHLITDQHINKFTASGHFHRTEPRNFKCKACHTFFGMKESYVHHLETESHQYVCTYCGITTATPSSRRAHIQNSHAEKLLLCEDCGECQNDIMAHFVIHGYTFECKKCVKKFYNRERLNAHMEVHQDPIECNWSDCNRMIATRSMLVTHYRGHKSEHKCTVCGQAFWNFAMLTSHLRSHQPMPRNPHVVSRSNQMGRATIQYQNQARPSPSVLQRSKSTAQPMLSNSVIKCGHCNNLFRSTKDLSLHKCAPKYPNNGDQNKLLELASKATAQAKAITTPNKMPARRRASPKKPQQPIEQQMIDLPAFHGQQPVDEDTQLIMILNQSTGELMEITAPKGMEVQDVINSLNFTPAVEDVQMEVIDEQSQQSAFANIVDVAQQEQQESANNMKQEHKILPTNEQDETAAAIEVIEQVNDETTASVQHVVEENQQPPTSNDNHGAEVVVAANSETEATTTVLIQQDGDDHQVTHQIIDSDDPNGSQAIVLPPECINEDGSLILDAETLQRLNLAISVDENGTITTPDGNTTFIIDTSKE